LEELEGADAISKGQAVEREGVAGDDEGPDGGAEELEEDGDLLFVLGEKHGVHGEAHFLVDLGVFHATYHASFHASFRVPFCASHGAAEEVCGGLLGQSAEQQGPLFLVEGVGFVVDPGHGEEDRVEVGGRFILVQKEEVVLGHAVGGDDGVADCRGDFEGGLVDPTFQFGWDHQVRGGHFAGLTAIVLGQQVPSPFHQYCHNYRNHRGNPTRHHRNRFVLQPLCRHCRTDEKSSNYCVVLLVAHLLRTIN
jgi:hypothetical protein